MEQKVRAMFAWRKQGEAVARRLAAAYTAANMEILCHGEADEAELPALGRTQQMTHVLFFLDEERLLLMSLADEMGGFTVEVNVSDLIL